MSKQTNPGLEAFEAARDAVGKGRFYAGVIGLAPDCNLDTCRFVQNPANQNRLRR